MYSLTAGLFHRAISQSGNALAQWALSPNGTTRYQAEKLAALLGCPTEPSNDLISCLRKKDAADIIATDQAFFVSNFVKIT
jgi:carboxylesterase type B